MFNPTKKNIKNEIIIYNSKLNQKNFRSNYPSIEALHYQYEPNALMFPGKIIENNKEISMKEFILSSKVKKTADEERKKFYPMKNHSVFKARSTLKKRVYDQNNIFNEPKTHNHQILIQDNYKPTAFFSFPKLFQSNSTKYFCNDNKNKKKLKQKDIIKENTNQEEVVLPYTNTNNNDNNNNKIVSNVTANTKQFHNFTHNSTLTHILDKKHDDSLPITLPMAITHNLIFSSQSQLKRNCKNIETLHKLKYFLTLHPDLKKQIICEFFLKNKISSQDYYSDEKLDNFARFIRSGIDINVSKTMKEIITDGVNCTEIDLTNYESKKEMKGSECDNNQIKGPTMLKRSISDLHTTFHSKSIPSLLLDMHEQNKMNDYHPELKATKKPVEYINNLKKDIERLNKDSIMINTTNQLNRCVDRMYYQIKHKKDTENLKDVARKKNKLLEYIVFQKAKAQQQLYEDTKEFIIFS